MRELDFRRDFSGIAIPREPVRDWRFGWMTGHRTRVIAFVVSAFGILLATTSLSPHGRPPQTFVEEMISWLSLLWLGALIPGSLGIIGALLYRLPSDLDDIGPISNMICWRIVTAGENIDVVLSTIRRCQAEMARTPLARYLIEIVIDECENAASLPARDADVRVIVVPREYTTPKRSRFKARALHYALLNSQIPETAWLVHLDEETQPTSSGVKGVCKFIHEEESSGLLRIGQGALVYHREWERHPFLTLADNIRTGDDLARFHLQHRLGVPIFGLHGSFIVVRNDVEKASGGFDFGPQGDITEDAFWALTAIQKGLRCAWVDGFMEEQSCMSIVDFLRQRRRWFQGLVKTALFAPTKMRWRMSLGLSTGIWALAPFALIYTIINLFIGVEIPSIVRILAIYSFSINLLWYAIGLRVNMDEHAIKGILKRARITLAQILLTPAFGALEALGVLWALASPARGFDVVEK